VTKKLLSRGFLTRKLKWAAVILFSLLLIQFYGLTASNANANSSTNTTTIVTQLWNFTIQERVYSPLVVTEDYIYAFSCSPSSAVPHTSVYCLNVSTGTQIWNHPIDGWYWIPAVADGRVYIEAHDKGVYSLNAFTGRRLWSFTNGRVDGTPVALGGYVYVPGSSYSRSTDTYVGFIYCLSASTGVEKWKYAAQGTSFHHQLVVSGSYLYAISNIYNEETRSRSSVVYAFNAFTGDRIWNTATPGFLYPPVVGGSNVYVSSYEINTDSSLYDGRVHAFNAASGTQLWSFKAETNVTSPTIAGNVVYFVTGDGKIYALNASTGAIMWNFATEGSTVANDYSKRPEKPPILANGYLYASYSNIVYCLDSSTGTKIWSFETDRPLQSSPTVANGTVYVGSSDRGGWDDKYLEHNLYALDALTGSKIWNYTFPGSIEFSPVVVGNSVYVGADYFFPESRSFLGVNAGVYALEQTTAVTPTPSPLTTLSDLQLTVIAAVVVIMILAVLFLVYRIRRKGADKFAAQHVVSKP